MAVIPVPQVMPTSKPSDKLVQKRFAGKPTFELILKNLTMAQGTILLSLSLRDIKELSTTCSEAYQYTYLFLWARKEHQERIKSFSSLDCQSLLERLEKQLPFIKEGASYHEGTDFRTLIYKRGEIVNYYVFNKKSSDSQGGCKTVKFPLDLKRKKIVAFSVMPPPIADREKRTLALVSKCSVVDQPLDCFSLGDKDIIVYPCYEGTRVRDLTRREELTPDLQKRILFQVTSSLQELHKFGVVHSDFKHNNLALVCDSDLLSVRIFDLEHGDLCGKRFKGGTPVVNMCPTTCYSYYLRQVQKLSFAHDAYGLGIFFYYVLAQKSPNFDYSILNKGSLYECVKECLNKRFTQPDSYALLFKDLPRYNSFYSLIQALIDKKESARPSLTRVLQELSKTDNELSQRIVKSDLDIHSVEKTNRFALLLNFIRNFGKSNIILCLSDNDLAALTLVSKFSWIFTNKAMKERSLFTTARQLTICSLPQLEKCSTKVLGIRRLYPFDTNLNFSCLFHPTVRLVSIFHDIWHDRHDHLAHAIAYDRNLDRLAIASSFSSLPVNYFRIISKLARCPYVLYPYDYIKELEGEKVILSPFSMQNYFQCHKKLTLHQKINLMCQMAEAINYMHQRGIVYLNCNLSYCFLSFASDSPEVRLFLHSRISHINDDYRSCHVAYDTPEAVRATIKGMPLKIQPSMDIWSLGIAFIFMLKEKFPFYVSIEDSENYFRFITSKKIVNEVSDASPIDQLNILLIRMLSINSLARPTIDYVLSRLKLILAEMQKDLV